MTRPMSEPSLPGQANRNKWGVRDLRRRPLAGRWYEPDCTPGGDCKGDEPQLENDWIQPTDGSGLEKFAFRRHMDGSLEFRGHLDASGGAVSGSVAVILPGVLITEPDFRLPKDQFWHTVITDDAGASFMLALVKIDSTTGDVQITWPAT